MAKRTKSTGVKLSEELPREEEERSLERLLAELRGDIDWGSLTPEDRRADRHR
jgi:hypothetical protein